MRAEPERMYVLLAGLLALVLARPAQAVEFYFEIASTTATSICPEPCFQVRMFAEDQTRVIDIQALQFEVGVVSGGSVAVLPVPPGSNTNAANGNVVVGEETLFVVPWELSATVGRSPNPNFDALIVSASATAFDVKSLSALFAAQGSTCSPASTCAVFAAGLAANRIYVGRFNMTAITSPPVFRLGGITGNGPGVTDFEYGLMRFNGGGVVCEGTTCRSDRFVHGPEPAGALLLGVALVLLAAWRRSVPRALLVLAAGIGLFPAGATRAEPPPLIQYQGILLAPNGAPRVGPVDLGIALFDAATQGNELYRERHPGVPLVDGSFTILIGGGQERVPAALAPAMFAGPGTRWLQISVDGEVLAPRQQMLSVPYAFESATSGSLQGRTLEQVVEAPSPVSGYQQLSSAFLGTSSDASCPAGKVVVGGGCDCAGATSESRPVGGYNAWHCECSGTGANRAWVLCAVAGGAVCGNGVRDSGEQCDSASASACSDGRCAEGCVCACGNGVLESPEQCDGSSATACAGNRCGADCRCTCGNGALDSGEQCDGTAGTCPAGGSCRVNCSCTRCGDGVVDSGEQCDGSAQGSCTLAGCDASCRCTCGNGTLDGGEQCDGQNLSQCPAGSSSCSNSCACVRCGDGQCTGSESATSCPADCKRAYRSCSVDRDCELGMYCRAGACTDSCYQTCDLDPDWEEACINVAGNGIGACVALCRYDAESSVYRCPNDLSCSSQAAGGICVNSLP